LSLVAPVSTPPFQLSLARLERVPLIVWCLLAVVAFGLFNFSGDATKLVKSLGDTDDATRLTQVRELIDGAPWFDRTLSRFGGPNTLHSHWSRLIDAPLALILSAARTVLSEDAAVRLLRTVWPLLVLLPLYYLIARYCRRRAGFAAALLSLVLVVYCDSGGLQFYLGRIDHHNVMIFGTVGGLLSLAVALVRPREGWLAGGLLGFALAIGYEPLALVVVSLAFAALYSASTGRGILGVQRAAIAFALTLAAALALTETPRQWFGDIHCDALSSNLVVLAAFAAAGMSVIAATGRRLSPAGRIAVLATFGAAGLAAYGFAEPVCMRGPLAEVDPALGPLWLDGVQEIQTLWQFLRSAPVGGAVFLITCLIGLMAAILNWRRRRDGQSLLLLAAICAGFALGAYQIRVIPYATFLMVPALAELIMAIPETAEVSPLAMRLTGLMFLNQYTTILAAAGLVSLLGGPVGQADTNLAANECLATASIKPLAKLEKGLVVTDVDLGPYIVALTNLDVLSAPYHRMDKSILLGERIRAAKPDIARAELGRIGARYVAACSKMPVRSDKDSLAAALTHGEAPAWLEPVALDGPTPVRVWRVK
jgi:hypothetical protein